MIVLRDISPVRIGHDVIRFGVGKPVPKIILDYWKETGEFDVLMKAGIIGNDSLRTGEILQSGHPNEDGRVDATADGDESQDSRSGGKRYNKRAAD